MASDRMIGRTDTAGTFCIRALAQNPIPAAQSNDSSPLRVRLESGPSCGKDLAAKRLKQHKNRALRPCQSLIMRCLWLCQCFLPTDAQVAAHWPYKWHPTPPSRFEFALDLPGLFSFLRLLCLLVAPPVFRGPSGLRGESCPVSWSEDAAGFPPSIEMHTPSGSQRFRLVDTACASRQDRAGRSLRYPFTTAAWHLAP